MVLACEGAVKGQTPCHVAATQCSSVVAWLQPGRAARECVNYTAVAEGEGSSRFSIEGGEMAGSTAPVAALTHDHSAL